PANPYSKPDSCAYPTAGSTIRLPARVESVSEERNFLIVFLIRLSSCARLKKGSRRPEKKVNKNIKWNVFLNLINIRRKRAVKMRCKMKIISLLIKYMVKTPVFFCEIFLKFRLYGYLSIIKIKHGYVV